MSGPDATTDSTTNSDLTAEIVTVLLPEDEYTHTPDEAENYNESMYLNAFDLGQQAGGWFRLGNRVNEGYAEMSVCIYLPDGSVGFMFGRPKIETNDVKCSHASTVGPIDDDQRFYLESRGVPPEIAERLVVFGFFDEVIDRLPQSEFLAGIRDKVIAKLGVTK